MTPPAAVIHIVEDLRTGGLEKVVRNIVVNLDRAYFDPGVWCLARGGEVADEIAAAGLRVQIMNMERRPSVGFLVALAGKLRRSGVRVAHCHGYTACTVGRTAAVLAGTPQVFAHIHTEGSWLQPRQRRIEKLLAVFSTKIICVSESVREFVVQSERISQKKTEVIYNGIADPHLPDRECARRHFGIQEGAKVLGCVASLEPHKGHAILIEAVRIARARLGDLVLLVVGDGTLRSELERLARDAGISAVFAGRIENVGLALAAVDAMALTPPKREGLPLAIIEAMSASKPVIGSRVGGIPEMVEDGVNGLLCRPGDAASAAHCIVKMFEDPALGRSMGEAGKKKFLERFTLGRMVSEIERLYGK